MTNKKVTKANGLLLMGINLRDALSGLLLLHAGDDSNNDSEGVRTSRTNNDSDATAASGRSDSTPIPNDRMDATPTSVNLGSMNWTNSDATATSDPSRRSLLRDQRQ
jgi:hypothetical protein